MRSQGLRARRQRNIPMPFLGYKATTNSNHSLPVAPNLLEQNFIADAPDQKWVSDITSSWTKEGWLYLAVVLERYSRRVWSVGPLPSAWQQHWFVMLLWLYTHGGTSGATTCLKGALSIRIGVASIALPPWKAATIALDLWWTALNPNSSQVSSFRIYRSLLQSQTASFQIGLCDPRIVEAKKLA